MVEREGHIPAWLEKYEPNAEALVQALGAMVTDRILQSIAEADYGYASEQHEPALRMIRKGSPPPDPSVSWAVPWEVLRLVQITDPRGERSSLGSVPCEQKAIAKAWACLLLVRFNEVERSSSLPRLTAVLTEYMPNLLPKYASLIHWLLTVIEEPHERRPAESAAAVLQRALGEFTPE